MNNSKHQRNGVLLVVVLAMLSLFSVLVVSYLVFTSQVAEITEVEQLDVLPINESLDSAVAQLISGTTNHQSVAYRGSLLEDLYGSDGMMMRVGNRRAGSSSSARAMPANATGVDARGAMIVPGRNQFFKFPTNLADWHDDVDSTLADELTTVPASFPRDLDDALSGRLVTFVDGPLLDSTFRVLRSFGGANLSDSNDGNNIEDFLAGSLVIDLETGPTEVEINGTPIPILSATPNQLLYDAGDDDAAGQAGVDDDGDSLVDEADELGYPGSDDFGYRFVLNGVPFNGRGMNPTGITGVGRIDSTGSPVGIDGAMAAELQFNSRLMGEQVFAGTPANRAFPEQDEPWDVADFENIFLAWQPSDHRRSNHGVPGYTAAEVADIGAQIIPSFHRPSVINYLMNSPIALPGEAPSPTHPTFWDLNGSGDHPQRLLALVTRIRRAVWRPLPFGNDYFIPTGNEDLDDDGLDFDGSENFGGSRPGTVLTLDSSLSFGVYKARVENLARWLVNGPWDVDNDNDTIPDSVWLDFQLPSVTTRDFRTLRPLVAVLVEDMDGKVNINQSGNYRQMLTSTFFNTNPTTLPAASNAGFDASYFSCGRSLGVFGFGGGVGPGETNFSHLFDFQRTGTPALYSQTSPRRTINTTSPFLYFIRTRYGNLLNTRYGGSPIDYASVFTTSDLHLPGEGDLSQSVSVLSSTDQLALVPSPARQAVHAHSNVNGKPMDLSGVGMERYDWYGNEVLTNATAVNQPNGNLSINEVLNQPYENGLPGDRTFSPGELLGLIDNLGTAGDLGTLLSDEIQRNRSLRHLITTDSQMIDVPELVNDFGVVGLFNRLVTVVGDKQVHLDRMMAPGLRKGGKLNLNRGLGNGKDDDSPVDGIVDDQSETIDLIHASVVAREASEDAFPNVPGWDSVNANYTPIASRDRTGIIDDFNGIDVDGDGVLDAGDDVNADGLIDKVADGRELLARHLYCLMYLLVADSATTAERIPDFPYPDNFSTNVDVRNRYAARRIAQWAVNAVDSRDTDAICTRLRYDQNPLDGFTLTEAANNVVWGMERPELEISETMAVHDKRLRRNLFKEMGLGSTNDGESSNDEHPTNSDSDMDQFRIPEASAFVELRSLRSPLTSRNDQPSLPPELYNLTNGTLELGRIVGTGDRRSPVWRLAVGEAVQGDASKSIRWLFDAERVGDMLAKQRGNPEQIDYLVTNAPANWANPGDIDTAIATWRAAAAAGAEVRVVNTASGEMVTLSDDDFDPTNDAASAYSVSLQRFVWFAELPPISTLNVLNDVRSGMRRNNVFFKRRDPVNSTDPVRPMNATPSLPLGGYAVVAPRVSTIFGQTNTVADPFLYDPSSQRIEFAHQSTGSGRFRLNYQDLSASAGPETPRYQDDGSGSANYHVASVLPIIAQSVTPDLIAEPPAPFPALEGFRTWANYRTNVGDAQEVTLGFNISAPLAGNTYYPAPTNMINPNAGPSGAVYPQVDGYRNYDAGTGDHADQPFDHVATTPLETNGWSAVGTHQEAVGVFLQRLADPTLPWHAIDNPYITVDLAPMDLTTMNGESDAGEQINRNMTPDTVDDKSVYSTVTNKFVPEVRFDTRRKIPDTKRDRAISVLSQATGTYPSNAVSAHRREVFTQRSALSASFNVLRETGVGGSTAVWDYQLGAMWNGAHNPADSGIDSTYQYNSTWGDYHPRMDLDPYRQTLGFVNREYGRPVGANSGTGSTSGADTAAVGQFGRGTPRGTQFLSLSWDDRDFQSPLDLMHIPAASRTGLLTQFSPGTRLESNGQREVADGFNHLLGFERNLGQFSAATGESVALTAEPSVPANADVIRGGRTAFEFIFDAVSTGEPSVLENNWFDPDEVEYFTAPANSRQEMFNRVVELFQPPFNYSHSFRKPGRINLNTTPDYLRKGPAFGGGASVFLDHDEARTGASLGSSLIQFGNPDRSEAELTSNFGTSRLLGNGSVYRSFAWANSTAYDLDTTTDRPRILGDVDAYGQTVDSPFGYGFKAFIESRRGYDDTSILSASNSLGNPNLSRFYPSQFAGVFSTARSAQTVPSVQRFLNFKKSGVAEVVRRRTQDMTVLRPHPDSDLRTHASNGLGDVLVESEDPSWPSELQLTGPTVVDQLSMARTGNGLFDRTIAELHSNYRHLARNPRKRFENAARLKNLTTHHSNVFLVRLTVGFFEVDPITGELGVEYVDPEINTEIRGRAAYVVDRSLPVGFLPGEVLNTANTITTRVYSQ